MTYVYILQSLCGAHFYVGMTWRIRTFIAFTERTQALAFERYLKSASGRAFATKRF